MNTFSLSIHFGIKLAAQRRSMGKAIMYYSYIQVISNYKTILCLSELMRTIFAFAYSKLTTTCVAVRDWFEDRPSYYETVNTHGYGAKILLMNSLHNR